MKNIFWVVICVLSLQVISIEGFSQDELSDEIDKLESNEVTDESVVNENPEASAQEVESEIEKQAEPFQEAAPAPETLPEDLEPQAPQEELSQPAYEEVPPTENLEDSLSPIEEEEAVATPTPVEPPAPEVAEQEDATEVVPSDFEIRLGRIYQQFYTEATTDEAWSQIVGDKVNETYSVQPGDTLWDISVTFFGNGHFWPKVWQVNDDITNPHSISAGYILKFFPGQVDQAPTLQMTKDGGTPATEAGENVTGLEDPSTPTPETVPVIPPPSKKYAAALEKLPPSLPFIRGRAVVGFDKDGFSVDSKKVNIKQTTVYVPSYMTESEPIKMGRVIDHEGERRTTAGIYDHIYVKLDNEAKPGDKFLSFNIGKKILSVDQEEYLGKPVYLQGEIQIQELINEEQNIYRAVVIKAINPILTDSYLTKDSLIVVDITEAGPSSNVTANVIGGQSDSMRRHMGMHEVIYLDKGVSDGMRPGQVLSIIRNPQIRGKKDMLHDLSQQIAKVKIVKATEKSATALVLNSKEDIRTGDYAGPLRTKPVEDGNISNPIEENSKNEPEFDSGSEGDEFIEGE